MLNGRSMKSIKIMQIWNNVNPCLSRLSTVLLCRVHLTPVFQYAGYRSVTTQYMWLPSLSILSIELLHALHVAQVQWSAVRSTCGSCPLTCRMQYMWLMSTDLPYAVHVAHVHWPAVCSTHGSCPLIWCTQYTLLMSIDLLHAVHVTHVHWYTVCSTRGYVRWSAVCSTRVSRSFSMSSNDLLYAVHVTTVFQYAIHWSSVHITGDSIVSVYCLLIYCT
jgi:hypothetical protein